MLVMLLTLQMQGGGSLYNALYGTDIISEKEGDLTEKGATMKYAVEKSFHLQKIFLIK